MFLALRRHCYLATTFALVATLISCQPHKDQDAPALPVETAPPRPARVCTSSFESLRAIQTGLSPDAPQATLVASLACVQAGWSKQDLLKNVGEPHERRDDSWVYWWIASESQGGPYFLAYVLFDGSDVVNIDAHAGHRSASGMLQD